MSDLIHPLALRAVRAIHALKSPPPAGSEHYRSGYDDGLEAAMDAVKNAIPTDDVPRETSTESFASLLAALGKLSDPTPQQMEEHVRTIMRRIADDVPRETSAEHEHDYAWTIGSWPSGPDGETDSLNACACGDQITIGSDDVPRKTSGGTE